MGVGSGGFAAALHAFNQVQRQMDRYMRERSQRRRHRIGVPAFDGPKRTEHACYWLCADCGFLAGEGGHPCPACGRHSWLDLHEHAIADTLRDDEFQRRMKPPAWILGGLLGVTLPLSLLVVWLADHHPLAWVLTAIAASAILLLAPRPLAVVLLRLRKSRPHRWRLPQPLPRRLKKARQSEVGPATATGETLTAPFTGQPCLAWMVCVLFDTPGDARPEEWVLEETVSTEMRVGSLALPAGRAVLNRAPRPVSPEELAISTEQVAEFLRQRGLFSSDGEFELFEACVRPGEPVEATLFENPTTVVIGTPRSERQAEPA